MTTRYRALCFFAAGAFVLALSGCATAPLQPPGEDLRAATAGSVLRSLSIDRAVERRAFWRSIRVRHRRRRRPQRSRQGTDATDLRDPRRRLPGPSPDAVVRANF